MLITASAAPYVQAKTVRAPAVTSDKRLALLPDGTGRGRDAGLQRASTSSAGPGCAPAKTPVAVVNRLNRYEVDDVLKTAPGARPAGQGPARCQAALAGSLRVVHRAGSGQIAKGAAADLAAQNGANRATGSGTCPRRTDAVRRTQGPA